MTLKIIFAFVGLAILSVIVYLFFFARIEYPSLSPTGERGRLLFVENCSDCHGENAGGSDLGPPLIHHFYRPDHHDDGAMRSAVKNGVDAHHWDFGPMPIIDGISEDEIDDLISFIRELQVANGIH